MTDHEILRLRPMDVSCRAELRLDAAADGCATQKPSLSGITVLFRWALEPH